MATEIILPALGETMDEGTIARWVTPDGAEVKKGQVIAEIESNKAVFELEATASGRLHVVAEAGVVVPILTVIAHILAPDEAPPAAGTNMTAVPSVPVIPEAGAAPAVPALPAPAGRQFVSPRARRLARARNVDVALVAGSGPQGRVEERDVSAYLEGAPRVTPLARKVAVEAGVTLAPAGSPRQRITRDDVQRQLAPAPPVAPPIVAQADAAVGAAQPLSVIRKVIAQRMAQSAHTAAAVTLTTEVDATELVHLREQVKAHVEQQTGQTLSYNVLLAKLAAAALHELPYMMSRLVGNEIQVPAAANIGIAVDTERGLLVPVVSDPSNTSLIDLAREANALMAKAKTGAVSSDDMAGGAFTITNLGAYGIDAFTPIINLPECAILGVGRIAPRPAVWQGQIAIRQMVILSLTFDHRLVDGVPASRFLQRLCELIQNPYIVLL
jgi:pyruvate dehydrogenase E2 component (dihydrolipoamide acetyltransferase)